MLQNVDADDVYQMVSHLEVVAMKSDGEANWRLHVEDACTAAVEDASRSCHEQLTQFCD